MFSQRRENERPDQAGARQHPSPVDSRGDSVTAKLEDFVILSVATASRSGAVAESKDPYQLKLAAAAAAAPQARANEFSAASFTSRSVSVPA